MTDLFLLSEAQMRRIVRIFNCLASPEWTTVGL